MKRVRLPEIMKDEGKRHRGKQKSDKMKFADESINALKKAMRESCEDVKRPQRTFA